MNPKLRACVIVTAAALAALPGALQGQEVIEKDGTHYLPEALEPTSVYSPPSEARIPVPHQFVDLALLDPPPLLEIRYASDNNFTGKQLYPFPGAWLRRDAAAALQMVIEELAEMQLGLKVFDAYRPPSAQRIMWETVGDPVFVSDPDGSRGKHTRGTAVDVTLIDRNGNELSMPTPFDELSIRAYRAYGGGTEEQTRNRQLLEDVMKRHGFEAFPYEWWHFDFTGWENRPAVEISFQDLRDGRQFASPAP